MEKHPLVLFDIGGVLLKLQFSEFYQAAARASGRHSPEEFKEIYVTSRLEEKALRGQITAAEFYAGLRNIVGESSDVSEIIMKMWDAPVEDMVHLKEEVYKSGVAVGLFSNIHTTALDILRPRHPDIFNVFNSDFPVILSHEKKVLNLSAACMMLSLVSLIR